MEITHRARLALFQPETVWTLEAGTLVETRGKAVRRFPLSGLTRYRLAIDRKSGRRSLLVTFGKRRLVIVSQSYLAPGRFEDRLAGFSTLARALAAVGADLSPRARFGVARLQTRQALTWIMGLLALGAAAMLVFSLTAGMAAVGVEMAARMAFVLILLAAALPWLNHGATFDPHDPPTDLLP
ncbi:hypothetical protein [Caulobacter sp. RL271]|uniref:Uncharacterized protein n=1 Tax=Caulobacter segnis TaxID=88688 RepID=A0ABY4ZVX5_9CAUL|nr:hypothetical protein [Caulobacter segnis]USQ96784.1 hypothetical protein MZV50_04175 [Caulobacter segnis]